MKIFTFKLNKEKIKQIPSNERKFFFTIAHLANEISALLKLYLWSSQYSPTNDAERDGQLTLKFISLSILAGKLREGQKFLWKYFDSTDLSKDYEPNLQKDGREALTKIRHYFKEYKSSFVNKIRNSLGFHYDPNALDKAFQEMPDDCILYLEPEGSVNNLYYFAEIIAIRAMLLEKGDLENKSILLESFQEIIDVARWFYKLAAALIAEFARRYIDGIWDGIASEVELKNLKSMLDIQISWFTDPTDAYTWLDKHISSEDKGQ